MLVQGSIGLRRSDMEANLRSVRGPVKFRGSRWPQVTNKHRAWGCERVGIVFSAREATGMGWSTWRNVEEQ